MSAAVPIIRQQGEGEQFWFAGGGVFTMKATAEETDGAFTMLEDEVVRGKTTPLHTHPFDEVIYVVDGEKVTYSNIADERSDRALSMYDVKVHVLSAGDRFDLHTRRPACGSAEGHR